MVMTQIILVTYIVTCTNRAIIKRQKFIMIFLLLELLLVSFLNRIQNYVAIHSKPKWMNVGVIRGNHLELSFQTIVFSDPFAIV